MTTYPKCNSFRTKKYGMRKNKRGMFQKFYCKDCVRQFIDNDFLWMQTPKHVVSFALRLWKKSVKPSEITEEMWLMFKIKTQR